MSFCTLEHLQTWVAPTLPLGAPAWSELLFKSWYGKDDANTPAPVFAPVFAPAPELIFKSWEEANNDQFWFESKGGVAGGVENGDGNIGGAGDPHLLRFIDKGVEHKEEVVTVVQTNLVKSGWDTEQNDTLGVLVVGGYTKL